MNSMNYEWISLILLCIILVQVKCYWLPVIQKLFNINKKSYTIVGQEALGDPTLNLNMNWNLSNRIMPFVGSIDYEKSRKFYAEIGFKVETGAKFCRININEKLSFWLQNYSNKQWLNNSMIFLDVHDLNQLRNRLIASGIESKYKNVKISEIQSYKWGDELFLHDPAGVLWHFCEYKNK